MEERIHSIIIDNYQSLTQIKTKWRDENEFLLQHATNVVNLQIKRSYLLSQDNWGIFKEDSDLQAKVKRKLLKQIDELMKRLSEGMERLQKLSSELQRIVSTVRSLKDEFSTSVSFGKTLHSSLFLSGVSLSRLLDLFGSVVEAHDKELEVKSSILSDLLFRFDRDILLIYLSAWKLEPYVSKHWSNLEICFSEK